MTPFIAVFDDFFPNLKIIEAILTNAGFKTETNPADGLSYRGIATNIELRVALYIRERMAQILGSYVVINAQFIRMMCEGLPPSKIHADHTMGEFSLHVYLNAPTDPQIRTGTQFWRSRSLGRRCPQDPIDQSLLDHAEEWRRDEFIEAKVNRALIHASDLFHSAVPEHGFGHEEKDARLVLTTFFSRRKP